MKLYSKTLNFTNTVDEDALNYALEDIDPNHLVQILQTQSYVFNYDTEINITIIYRIE